MLKRIVNVSKLFSRKKIVPTSNLMVVITGCDSGLGLLMAKAAHHKGLTVVAGVLQGVKGDGAQKLQKMGTSKRPLHVVELDVTSTNSVNGMKMFVKELLEKDSNMHLHAVVNNAGVMIMGDFEWQTESMIDKQLEVNILGTWRVTKHLLWALREVTSRGLPGPRIINISSHCSLQPLRTMTVYSATKAALKAWSEGLRMELYHSGVHVVDYIPGRISSSNILSNQKKYFEEMKQSLDEEQLKYYLKYFEDYESYITMVGELAASVKLESYEDELKDKFLDALLDAKPKAVYKTEPWRYTIYYNLFKITPNIFKHWLMERFLMLPSMRINK